MGILCLNLKNLTARLLTTFFIFSLTSINVQATSTQPNKENIKNEKEVIDITNDPNYVVSKGDVSLENIELSVNENELVINSKKGMLKQLMIYKN